MPVDTLFALVEDPSTEAALAILLPKILRSGIRIELRNFRCKTELMSRLPQRLAAFAQWLPDTSRILVLVDRDDEDCRELKTRLHAMAERAQLGTHSAPISGRVHVINRIAIEELEAWFFGDWAAVRAAFPRLDPNTSAKAAYRQCDEIAGGTWEALERELQKRRYHVSGLRKVELARTVAAHMNPAVNRSPSFCAMRDALHAL